MGYLQKWDLTKNRLWKVSDLQIAAFPPALVHTSLPFIIRVVTFECSVTSLYFSPIPSTPPYSLSCSLAISQDRPGCTRHPLLPTVSWTKAVTPCISQQFVCTLYHFAVPSLEYHGSCWEIMEALCGCRILKAYGAFPGPLAPSCGPDAALVGSDPLNICKYLHLRGWIV